MYIIILNINTELYWVRAKYSTRGYKKKGFDNTQRPAQIPTMYPTLLVVKKNPKNNTIVIAFLCSVEKYFPA